MKERIKVIKATKERIIVKDITNELKYIQKKIDGYIECFDIGIGLTIICDEVGKIKNLPQNIMVMSNNRIVDIICGNCIICRYNEKGEFTSLNEEDINKLMNDPDFYVYRTVKVGEL